MNAIQNEKQAMRELSLEEIEGVSGGAEWKCQVTVDQNGKASVSCSVSGTF